MDEDGSADSEANRRSTDAGSTPPSADRASPNSVSLRYKARHPRQRSVVVNLPARGQSLTGKRVPSALMPRSSPAHEERAREKGCVELLRCELVDIRTRRTSFFNSLSLCNAVGRK